jgi:hypothetical protein
MHCQGEELYKERSEMEQGEREEAKVGRQLKPTFSIPHDVLTDLGCISRVGNADNCINE